MGWFELGWFCWGGGEGGGVREDKRAGGRGKGGSREAAGKKEGEGGLGKGRG